MSDSDDLAAKLAKRNAINEGELKPEICVRTNIYAEFKEFSRKQVNEYKATFKKYDVDGNNFLDLMELTLMMEKLGSPQTRVMLKSMIKEVDEDNDGIISFREFLLIYRKAYDGSLQCEGLISLANLTEVDVSEVGVLGAKNFFETKAIQANSANKFEMEIKLGQEEKRREEETARKRKESFKARAAVFN